ncbi:MAG TPA: hypothetical protein VK140_06155 [Ktedonobacteraceae bacterium]|nr:hypothetical protein [Ktedonobacteraceae bacterium]
MKSWEQPERLAHTVDLAGERHVALLYGVDSRSEDKSGLSPLSAYRKRDIY